MNIQTTAASSAPQQGLSLVSPADVIRAWLNSYIRHRIFKAAREELMALDDRLLRDIGLDRSEISSALLDATGERITRAMLPNQPF